MKKQKCYISLFLGLLVIAVSITGCYEKKQKQFPLVAVQNHNGISGSFFLASGSIGSQEYFVFRYRDSHGAIRSNRIAARWAIIYEVTNTQPYVEGYVYKEELDRLSTFRLTFYIPPDSIAREIKIQ